MSENPMVAVVREELRKKTEYADECEAQVRRTEERLRQEATLRDLADEDEKQTRVALLALLALSKEAVE